MDNTLPSIKILGTKITTSPKKDILEYIIKCIEKKTKKIYIVTPNPEILVYATRSSSFQKTLNNATVSLADGVGITLSGSILKKSRFTRITGVDFMETLCTESAKRAFSIGLLGGKQGVAKRTAECLQKKYPKLIVSFVGEEWPAKMVDGKWLMVNNSSSTGDSSSTINHQSSIIPHIDILFVAFGFPKQEEWIAKNLDSLPVTVAMGVGGAFDYISGRVPRAPELVRRLGFEWAFRLTIQPWRIKRQMALPVFVYKVLQEKLREITR